MYRFLHSVAAMSLVAGLAACQTTTSEPPTPQSALSYPALVADTRVFFLETAVASMIIDRCPDERLQWAAGTRLAAIHGFSRSNQQKGYAKAQTDRAYNEVLAARPTGEEVLSALRARVDKPTDGASACAAARKEIAAGTRIGSMLRFG
ncbi:DUF5333 family protein [Pseudoruegeria sp. HB172150]|uniref:DUF5333 family protein n=1 Tax=Pseudoruegeria sp. HB172150 TaxID=2721164 RepID=UPI001552B0B8|nr:DUF5333 family protein [Pseudoruegeria sp. HB172150]